MGTVGINQITNPGGREPVVQKEEGASDPALEVLSEMGGSGLREGETDLVRADTGLGRDCAPQTALQ